ncbi:Undecaprenyl-phosphate 4-deoxy-4-formamido-L-arabinose transferase [Roseimaritima multifibrata]|uniref:Undecaprenyl-phosphate 4-deoxy-4-formamido-L-arabinose transferase n=2 Tax=Roseimaritima multifibrata TaxID=1930274 RepID=A0A517MCY0_9BACT|nr:Undecaprenyl-phosphate 4-deoxy-4-formamido-L-arabinose transferase [Roseimaritima multifibrata]
MAIDSYTPELEMTHLPLTAATDPTVQWSDAYVQQCQNLLGPAVCRELGIFALPDGFILSVIVPVYNEAETIAAVVSRLNQTGLPLEIILVDDGSEDGSADVLDRLAGEGLARVIHHAKNRGKGAAVRTGLQAATGVYVVIQDADLEYDPEDFRRLLQPLVADEADVVYGSRYGGVDKQVSGWWHQTGNGVITRLMNMAIGLKLSDVETCYKMARRDAWQQIAPRLRENRFGIEIEATAYLSRLQLRFAERSIRYRPRWYDEGKKIGWKDGVRAIWCIFYYGLLRRG